MQVGDKIKVIANFCVGRVGIITSMAPADYLDAEQGLVFLDTTGKEWWVYQEHCQIISEDNNNI